jgi:uncharacterized membrane protein
MSGMETTSDAAPATAAGRPASLLPTVAIALVALVVAIVFFADRTWYTFFLTIHILGVVVWIGGGLLLTTFGILAERTRDGIQLAQIGKMAAFAGERIFSPAAIVVLIMGIAMGINANWDFGQFWLIFGLLGFLTTFILGIAVLSPMAKRLNALAEEKGPLDPEVLATVSKILLIARADVAMLVLVIVDMVAKPFL